MKKIIIVSLIITGCFGWADAVFLKTSTITATGGVLDYQAGNIYVGTPILSTETANKAYVDASAGDNLGNHTATTTLTMNGYDINTSSGITGLKRIVWDDGTVQVSSPTAGVGNGGQPDIMFDYTGDTFNSTTTYINGLSRIISKYALTVASYQVYIGSATTDTFNIRISTAVLGSSWVSAEVFSVPVGVSSHTVNSAGYTISDGGVVSFGFEAVDATDPPGDVSIRISD